MQEGTPLVAAISMTPLQSASIASASGRNVSPAFTVVSPKLTATGGKAAKASSISPTTPKLTAEQKKELREAAKNLTAERKRVKDRGQKRAKDKR